LVLPATRSRILCLRYWTIAFDVPQMPFDGGFEVQAALDVSKKYALGAWLPNFYFAH
jgi:hypothetical protein